MTPSSTPSRSRASSPRAQTSSTTPLRLYCAKDADEATKAFLEFMLSDDVQGKLVEEQGFIPVSAMKVVKDASGKVSAK